MAAKLPHATRTRDPHVVRDDTTQSFPPERSVVLGRVQPTGRHHIGSIARYAGDAGLKSGAPDASTFSCPARSAGGSSSRSSPVQTNKKRPGSPPDSAQRLVARGAPSAAVVIRTDRARRASVGCFERAYLERHPVEPGHARILPPALERPVIRLEGHRGRQTDVRDPLTADAGLQIRVAPVEQAMEARQTYIRLQGCSGFFPRERSVFP